MRLILQAIKSLFRKVEGDIAEMKEEVSDPIGLSAECGLVDPVVAEDGSIYTDENNTIYTL